MFFATCKVAISWQLAQRILSHWITFCELLYPTSLSARANLSLWVFTFLLAFRDHKKLANFLQFETCGSSWEASQPFPIYRFYNLLTTFFCTMNSFDFKPPTLLNWQNFLDYEQFFLLTTCFWTMNSFEFKPPRTHRHTHRHCVL